MQYARSIPTSEAGLNRLPYIAFQYDLSSRASRAGIGISLGGLPLWFIEGMAEYLSVGPVDPVASMWMRVKFIPGF